MTYSVKNVFAIVSGIEESKCCVTFECVVAARCSAKIAYQEVAETDEDV